MHVFLVCYQNTGINEYQNIAQKAVFQMETLKLCFSGSKGISSTVTICSTVKILLMFYALITAFI